VLKPQVEALADELADKINFFKMGLVSNQQLLIDLNVSGLPCFLFFRNGEKISFLAGNNILIDEIKNHSLKLLN
jgi:thioredoxin 1